MGIPVRERVCGGKTAEKAEQDARRRGGPARMTAEKPARSRVLQRGMNKKSA